MTFDPTFGKTGLALRTMQIRRDRRMTQAEFAERFGITYGVLTDCEQMRGTPSRATRVLVEAIALDPALIERAARNAAQWGD